MRRIAIATTLCALALLAGSAATAGIVGLRPGGVRGLGPSAPHGLAPGSGAVEPGGAHRIRPPAHRPPRRRPRTIFVPIFRDRDRDEPDVIVVPIPAPLPEPVPEAAPPAPPDPQGAIRRLPARGAAGGPAAPAIGSGIAADTPLVILDWRTHDLPEPPPGEVWVRLRREVLRIDASSRVVRAIGLPPDAPAVPPAEAGAAPPTR